MGKQQTSMLRCAEPDDEAKTEFLEESKSSKYTTLAASKLCDYLEAAILWAFDDYNEKKPQYWLTGNYAPVEEFQPETGVPITGTIPVCLFHSILFSRSDSSMAAILLNIPWPDYVWNRRALVYKIQELETSSLRAPFLSGADPDNCCDIAVIVL